MKNKNMIRKILHFFSENASIIGLAFMLLVGTLINSSFLTVDNISNILRQMSTVSIVTLGMTVVIITHNSALTAMADRVIQVKSGSVTGEEVNASPVPVEEIEW